jgi:protein-tyrosine phosphatase
MNGPDMDAALHASPSFSMPLHTDTPRESSRNASFNPALDPTSSPSPDGSYAPALRLRGRSSAASSGRPGSPHALTRRAFLKSSARAVALSGLGACLLSACGGGNDTTDVPAAVQLTSVENFRDVSGSGAGYPTTDGRRTRRGMFYRSGTLSPDDADAATLARLGIAQVYDLRVAAEVDARPDRLPYGAVRSELDISPIDVSAVRPASEAEAVAWMSEAERRLVTDAQSRSRFGALFTQLANTSGPHVFHGSTGKDRTGWAAALLLAIAGVPLDVIMQDYLLTNTIAATAIAARIDALARRTDATLAAHATPLYQAQPDVLQAAFDQMQQSFGTLNSYLTAGLGLSQGVIDTLREKLVV